jgi:hypothetical protein
MFPNHHSIHVHHTQRTAELRDIAQRERLFAARHAARPRPRPALRRIRHQIGRSMVTIGKRLEADPSPRRARSR